MPRKEPRRKTLASPTGRVYHLVAFHSETKKNDYVTTLCGYQKIKFIPTLLGFRICASCDKTLDELNYAAGRFKVFPGE